MFDPNRYCSSRGFKVEGNHTSANCTRPHDTHNKLATLIDTKRGLKWNKDWVNGGPIKLGGA